jgi:hypothetical protein
VAALGTSPACLAGMVGQALSLAGCVLQWDSPSPAEGEALSKVGSLAGTAVLPSEHLWVEEWSSQLDLDHGIPHLPGDRAESQNVPYMHRFGSGF